MSDTDELKDKLVRLEVQLQDVTGMKKSMAKDYNDQLKDIKREIKEVVEELDPKNAPPPVDSDPVDFE
jgi:predicted  nucleic acid-binding Zn-ribbon protein